MCIMMSRIGMIMVWVHTPYAVYPWFLFAHTSVSPLLCRACRRLTLSSSVTTRYSQSKLCLCSRCSIGCPCLPLSRLTSLNIGCTRHSQASLSLLSFARYFGIAKASLTLLSLLHRLISSSSSLQGIAKASFLRSVDLSGNAYIEGVSRLRRAPE